MPTAYLRRRGVAALIGVWVAAGCSSGAPLPPVDEGLTGTMLLRGQIAANPGSAYGLLTYRWTTGTLSPIALGSFNDGSLAPDGMTAYGFATPVGGAVYRLVASRQIGAEIPLLEFPSPGGIASPVGLAVDQVGERIGFTERFHGSTVRLYRVGRAGWTDILEYPGFLEGLDWHPDGRRLLTVVYDDVTPGQIGEGTGRIAIIDIEAKTVTPIGPVGERLPEDAVFSPDGRSIVYTRLNADNLELASIGFDGGRATPLPPQLEGYRPIFSPDGRYLAYCKQVRIGINQLPVRFVRRLADGATQQILPPETFPTLGCITDWVR